MAYYPLKGEVAILEFMRRAQSQKRFCFPVMDAKVNNLRVFTASADLQRFVRGPFGVMEPDIKLNQEVDIGEIDMILIPGLAFDYRKNRLGRGGGFYDRFLKSVTPPTVRVGLAFDFQILESLPVDPDYDIKVDVIVGENEILS